MDVFLSGLETGGRMSAYSSLVVNDMHFSRIIALRSPSLRAIIPTLFSFLENQNKPTNQK